MCVVSSWSWRGWRVWSQIFIISVTLRSWNNNRRCYWLWIDRRYWLWIGSSHWCCRIIRLHWCCRIVRFHWCWRITWLHWCWLINWLKSVICSDRILSRSFRNCYCRRAWVAWFFNESNLNGFSSNAIVLVRVLVVVIRQNQIILLDHWFLWFFELKIYLNCVATLGTD